MPAAYSTDIRGRVIASVESGSSRREAAEEFDVSPSSAILKRVAPSFVICRNIPRI